MAVGTRNGSALRRWLGALVGSGVLLVVMALRSPAGPPPEPEPTPVGPGGDPGSRRRLPVLLGAGVVLLVLVVIAVWALSGGGGDEAPPTAAPREPAPGGRGPTTTTAPGTGGGETFEVFTTRNPFLPLRSPQGGPLPPGAAGPQPSPGGPAPLGVPPARPPAPGRTEPRRGPRVALLDVFAEGRRTVANVRVNDTVYKVAPGQSFASGFRVVSLSRAEGCGRFLFGGNSFRLCKDEEILK